VPPFLHDWRYFCTSQYTTSYTCNLNLQALIHVLQLSTSMPLSIGIRKWRFPNTANDVVRSNVTVRSKGSVTVG
jgi:hypothetical protein